MFLLFLWNRHGARIPNYEDVVDLQVVLFQETLTFNSVIKTFFPSLLMESKKEGFLLYCIGSLFCNSAEPENFILCTMNNRLIVDFCPRRACPWSKQASRRLGWRAEANWLTTRSVSLTRSSLSLSLSQVMGLNFVWTCQFSWKSHWNCPSFIFFSWLAIISVSWTRD